MSKPITGVAVADLHLGIDNVGGVDENGVPRRLGDFLENFDLAVSYAILQRVDLFLVLGDIFKSRNPPQRTLYPFERQILRLTAAGIQVIILKGNHEGESGSTRANVLDTLQLLDPKMVLAINHPMSAPLAFSDNRKLHLVAIPWLRLKDLADTSISAPYDELCAQADARLRKLIADFCSHSEGTDHKDAPLLLIGHLAVAGADRASEKWMTLGFEPIITTADIPPNVTLAMFGHYHKGGQLAGHPAAYYCGSIARIDWGEAGQDKTFWSFELGDGPPKVEAHPIPDRPFVDLAVEVADGQDATAAILQEPQMVSRGVDGAIIRLRVTCASAEQAAVFDHTKVEQALRDAGAWWISGIDCEGPQTQRRWSSDDIEGLEPSQILMRYLEGKEADATRRQRLWSIGIAIMEGRDEE